MKVSEEVYRHIDNLFTIELYLRNRGQYNSADACKDLSKFLMKQFDKEIKHES